jgi:hypothetical protein
MLRVVYVDHHTLTVLGNEVLSSGRPHAHGDLVTFSGLRWRVHSAGIINGSAGLVETVTLRVVEEQFTIGASVLADVKGREADSASAHAA